MADDDPRDEALAAAAASGDDEAFDALVRRYQPRLVRLVRARWGGHADVEDLVQEVFIRAYRGMHRFRGDSSVWSWLYRIAMNLLADEIGRRQRLGALMIEPGAAPPETIEAVPALDDLELRVMQRVAIERALATLPRQLRHLVELREIEGFDYREIARVARLPRGTVDSRLFRARRRLRPLLARLLEERAPPLSEENRARGSPTHRRVPGSSR